MKPRQIARSLILPLVCLGSIAAAQTMYKSVDDNGRVTYSDTPPIGKVKTQETIRILGPSNPGAARQVFDQDAQLKKRQDDSAKKQAVATKKEELEAAKRDACSRARGEMRALRENVPIMRITDSGDRLILDETAREGEAKRLETYVEENCAQSG